MICAIILDYFGADKTEACLRSLIGQGLDAVCVVDNSAAREASANLHAAINRLATIADYKIEILSPGQNLGFAKGVNFALRYVNRDGSPFEYYLLINNDAIAGPALVAELVSRIGDDKDIALVSPRVVSSKPQREYGIWYHRYLGLLLANRARFSFHYFTGCCLLFRRELVDRNGLFDEAFFMYGEDVELAWRLTQQGKKMVCATNVYVEHEYGPSVDRSSFFYEYHMVRGHLLLSVSTWIHPAEVPLLILTKYLSLISRAIIRYLRNRRATALWALLAATIPGSLAQPRSTTTS